MHKRPSECEVYCGMHSQRLVLRLDNDDLQVSVHPNFPKQRLTITVELDPDSARFLSSRRIFQESARLSVQHRIIAEARPLLRRH
jgi:hypothetical protein